MLESLHFILRNGGSMVDIKVLINAINNVIWSAPLVATIVGTGVYFSFKLKILQIFQLKRAFKYLLSKSHSSNDFTGDISSFASLCTALSATLGVGNIVGIALAISIGGPGSIFWMWVSAFFGMATKYAEGLLAIKYRKIGSDKKIAGGPMYYIEYGLGRKVLAKLFALSGMGVALIGIGTMAQTNSMAAANLELFGIQNWITAVVTAIVVAIVTFGGIHKIASVSEKIVPLMTICYVAAGIAILVINIKLLPHAMYMIFVGAFSPEAILGGGLGVGFINSLQMGVTKGIFSHESGLGSAAIAAAAAKTNSSVKQGLTSMLGVFFSILVCTMTGLVLIITSAKTSIFSGECIFDGAVITSHAFCFGLGTASLGKYVVNLGILFFAFTTIVGWNYYGEKCVQYLFGTKAILFYRLLFIFFVYIGPFAQINTIFSVADVVIGLMAITNSIGLIGLRKVVIDETRKFFHETSA
jgi:AGCS family alanine or glycine:cation symporter